MGRPYYQTTHTEYYIMNIQSSFKTQTKNLNLLQILLNKHNGRFVSQLDPKLLQFSETVYLTIGFDYSKDFANFTSDWRLLTEEVTEVNKPAWTIKVLRRLRGEIKHLQSLFAKV